MANEEFIKFLNEIFGDVFNHLFLLTILSMIVIIELIVINMIGLRKMLMLDDEGLLFLLIHMICDL